MSHVPALPLSVVVMTRNEVANIRRCLESVAGLAKEICILDSHSTDATVDIAKTYGARIELHPFVDFVSQRRRLLDMAHTDWVLMLDADEVISPELRSSIQQVLQHPTADGYSCNRRNRIGDRWIRHGSWYPDQKIRLFDKRKFNVEGIGVHEMIVPRESVRIEHLAGDLLHYADEDIHARFEKVQEYSLKAAQGLYAAGRKARLWRMLIKPGLRFFWTYVVRRGFLDGYYGYIIARSEAMYVWLREVKLWEMARTRK